MGIGCDHCWARRMSKWPFVPQFDEARLKEPGDVEKSCVVFVAPMGDLCHGDISETDFARTWMVMANASQHLFLVLTKRPRRLFEFFLKTNFPVKPNIWIGTSIENLQTLNRARWIVDTPAAMRFLSLDPLLGSLVVRDELASGVDMRMGLDYYLRHKEMLPPPAGLTKDELKARSVDWRWALGWIIVGGESGPDARPMHPNWVREIRDRCRIMTPELPFYFKQWGEWASDYAQQGEFQPSQRFTERTQIVEHEDVRTTVFRVGKRRAGCLLDGKTHFAVPTWIPPNP